MSKKKQRKVLERDDEEIEGEDDQEVFLSEVRRITRLIQKKRKVKPGEYRKRGRCYLKLKEYENSVSDLEKCLDLLELGRKEENVNVKGVYIDLSSSCYHLGKFEECFYWCSKVQEIEPHDINSATLQANCILEGSGVDKIGKSSSDTFNMIHCGEESSTQMKFLDSSAFPLSFVSNDYYKLSDDGFVVKKKGSRQSDILMNKKLKKGNCYFWEVEITKTKKKDMYLGVVRSEETSSMYLDGWCISLSGSMINEGDRGGDTSTSFLKGFRKEGERIGIELDLRHSGTLRFYRNQKMLEVVGKSRLSVLPLDEGEEFIPSFSLGTKGDVITLKRSGIMVDEEKLIKKFEKTLGKHTKPPEILNYVIACCSRKIGKYEKAIQYLKKCVSNYPKNHKFHKNMGFCHFRLGLNKEGLESFEKFLILVEKSEKKKKGHDEDEICLVRYYLSLIYQELESSKKATVELENALILQNEQQKMGKEMKKGSKKILAGGITSNIQADLFLIREEFEKALPLYSYIIGYFSNFPHPQLRMKRALCYFRLSMFQECVNECLEILKNVNQKNSHEVTQKESDRGKKGGGEKKKKKKERPHPPSSPSSPSWWLDEINRNEIEMMIFSYTYLSISYYENKQYERSSSYSYLYFNYLQDLPQKSNRDEEIRILLVLGKSMMMTMDLPIYKLPTGTGGVLFEESEGKTQDTVATGHSTSSYLLDQFSFSGVEKKKKKKQKKMETEETFIEQHLSPTEKIQKTEKVFRKVMEICPENEEGVLGLGCVLLHQQKYQKALEMFEKLFGESLILMDLCPCHVGFCLYKLGRFEESIDFFQDLHKNHLSTVEDNYEFYYYLGLSYKKTSEHEKSIEYLKRSITAHDQSSRDHKLSESVSLKLKTELCLAESDFLISKKEFEKALSCLDDYLGKTRRDKTNEIMFIGNLYLNRIKCHFELKNLKKTEEELSQMINNRPKILNTLTQEELNELYYLQSRTYFLMNDFEKAYTVSSERLSRIGEDDHDDNHKNGVEYRNLLMMIRSLSVLRKFGYDDPLTLEFIRGGGSSFQLEFERGGGSTGRFVFSNKGKYGTIARGNRSFGGKEDSRCCYFWECKAYNENNTKTTTSFGVTDDKYHGFWLDHHQRSRSTSYTSHSSCIDSNFPRTNFSTYDRVGFEFDCRNDTLGVYQNGIYIGVAFRGMLKRFTTISKNLRPCFNCGKGESICILNNPVSTQLLSTRKDFEKFLFTNPKYRKDFDVIFTMGCFQFLEDCDCKGALERFEECLIIKTSDFSSLRNAGYCLFRLNRMDEALDYFVRCEEIGKVDGDHHYFTMYYIRSLIYNLKEEYLKAQRDILKVLNCLQLHSNSSVKTSRILRVLANHVGFEVDQRTVNPSHREGRAKMRIDDFRKDVELRKKEIEGNLHFERKEYGKAIESLKDVLHVHRFCDNCEVFNSQEYRFSFRIKLAKSYYHERRFRDLKNVFSSGHLECARIFYKSEHLKLCDVLFHSGMFDLSYSIGYDNPIFLQRGMYVPTLSSSEKSNNQRNSLVFETIDSSARIQQHFDFSSDMTKVLKKNVTAQSYNRTTPVSCDLLINIPYMFVVDSTYFWEFELTKLNECQLYFGVGSSRYYGQIYRKGIHQSSDAGFKKLKEKDQYNRMTRWRSEVFSITTSSFQRTAAKEGKRTDNESIILPTNFCSGDVIGVVLDHDRSLGFYHNGKFLGVHFTGVNSAFGSGQHYGRPFNPLLRIRHGGDIISLRRCTHLSNVRQINSVFNEALRSNRDSFQVYYGLGCVSLFSKNYKEAKNNLKKCTELNPEFHDAKKKLGVCLFLMNSYEEAMEVLSQCVDLVLRRSGHDYEVNYFLGLSYQELGQPNKAIECYQKSIPQDMSKDVNYSRLTNNERSMVTSTVYGEMYFSQKKYTNSVSSFSSVIKNCGICYVSPLILKRRAQAYYFQKNFELAIGDLREYIINILGSNFQRIDELELVRPDIYLLLARCYYEVKRYDMAIDLYSDIIQRMKIGEREGKEALMMRAISRLQKYEYTNPGLKEIRDLRHFSTSHLSFDTKPKTVEVSKDGLSATTRKGYRFLNVLCAQEIPRIPDKNYYWEFEVSNLGNRIIMIGVCNKFLRCTEEFESSLGWAVNLLDGSLVGNNQRNVSLYRDSFVENVNNDRFSPKFRLRKGDVIGVELDLRKNNQQSGTLSFYYNRKYIGIAFTQMKTSSSCESFIPFVRMSGYGMHQKDGMTQISFTRKYDMNNEVRKEIVEEIEKDFVEVKKISSEAKPTSEKEEEEILHGLGCCSVQKEEYEHAIDMFLKCVHLNGPNYYSSLKKLGFCYYKMKKYGDSISYYSKCEELSKNPNEFDLLYYLSKCFLHDSTNIKKSIQYFEKSIDALKNQSVFFKNTCMETLEHEMRANIGEIHIRAGDYKKLMEVTNSLRNKDWIYYRLLGLHSYHSKKFDDAIKWFSQALELLKSSPDIVITGHKRTIEVLELRGQSFQKMKNCTSSIGDFSMILSLNPTYKGAYYQRGVLNKQSRNFEKAIEDFKKRIELFGENLDVFVHLGECYSALRDHKESVKYFSDAILLIRPTESKRKDIFISRAESYHHLKEYQKTVDDFTKIIVDIDPNDSDVHHSRGVNLELLGEFESAIKDFTQALQIGENPLYYFSRGSLFFKMKKYEDVIPDFSAIILKGGRTSKNINMYEVYKIRGVSYYHLKEFGKAVDDLGKSEGLFQKYRIVEKSKLCLIRAECYEEMKSFNLSIRDYSKSIGFVPDNSETYFRRAKVYFVKKNFQKCIHDCKNAIRINQNDENTILLLGDSFLELGDYKSSDESYSKVIQFNSSSSEAYFKRGNVFRILRKFDEAQDDLSRAIKHDPSNASYRLARGKFLMERKKLEEAKYDFEEAIKIDPYFLEAINLKEECVSKIKKQQSIFENVDDDVLVVEEELEEEEEEEESSSDSSSDEHEDVNLTRENTLLKKEIETNSKVQKKLREQIKHYKEKLDELQKVIEKRTIRHIEEIHQKETEFQNNIAEYQKKNAKNDIMLDIKQEEVEKLEQKNIDQKMRIEELLKDQSESSIRLELMDEESSRKQDQILKIKTKHTKQKIEFQKISVEKNQLKEEILQKQRDFEKIQESLNHQKLELKRVTEESQRWKEKSRSRKELLDARNKKLDEVNQKLRKMETEMEEEKKMRSDLETEFRKKEADFKKRIHELETNELMLQQENDKLRFTSSNNYEPPTSVDQETLMALENICRSSSSSSFPTQDDNQSTSAPTMTPEIISLVQQYKRLEESNCLIEYGKITFGEQIGQGTFSKCYRGTFQYNEYAIKVLNITKMDDEKVKEFLSEISMMITLRHPNILTIFACCLTPKYCIVTEYTSKGCLFDILSDCGKGVVTLDWKKRLRIGKDVAKALLYLHMRNVYHRDLKSSNVLIGENGTAKICDFGVSIVSKEKKLGGEVQGIVGTIQWVAPELIDGISFTDKCDVYSYGVTMWEIATLKIPYEEHIHLNSVELVNIVRKRSIGDQIPETTPAFFRKIILECMNEDPSRRPTIEQVLERFEVDEE